MKVLASLKPYYYYLVGEGIKKIEVRKGCPKSKDWDGETYFYMSKDEKSFSKIPKEFQEKYRRHFGKVGLKFVCDKITMHIAGYKNEEVAYWDLLEGTCLTKEQLWEYGHWKRLYGWHIANLKIYDKPKEISEFKIKRTCNGCKVSGYESSACPFDEECIIIRELTRPPQSWCYVEELKGERK